MVPSRFAILGRSIMSGQEISFSHLDTACGVTPEFFGHFVLGHSVILTKLRYFASECMCHDIPNSPTYLVCVLIILVSHRIRNIAVVAASQPNVENGDNCRLYSTMGREFCKRVCSRLWRSGSLELINRRMPDVCRTMLCSTIAQSYGAA